MPVQFNDPLPSSLNNEHAVIGCVFIEPACISQVDFLKPEHFYAHDHRWVWQACLDAEEPDYQVVVSLLKARGQLNKVGDPTRLHRGGLSEDAGDDRHQHRPHQDLRQ